MFFSQHEKIVFAGDSVTDHYSTNPIGEGPDGLGQGYVQMVENSMSTWYPEMPIRIINAGISGNTSRDLLSRFQRDVISLKPDWISICIGINDVWSQFRFRSMFEMHVYPDEYEKNLEQMITATKENVKGIFIMTPYYIEPSSGDSMRARMDEYANICRQLAKKHGCILVDLQQAFDQQLRFTHSSYLALDGVHPSQVGCAVIARAFLDRCEFDYSHSPE